MEPSQDAADARSPEFPAPEVRRAGRPADNALQLLLPFLIAAVVIVLFYPVLANRFVNWGDEDALLTNEQILGLRWENLRWMMTTFQGGRYQPLAWLSFALDFRLWDGFEPFGFHLTSVLLHAVNGVLLYLVMRKLLALVRKDADWETSLSCALATILFAVHPLRMEPVAWAAQRGDVLSAAFFLAAVLLYLQAHESRLQGRSAAGWITLAVVMGVLSALARSLGGAILIVLLVLDVYPLRRLGGGPGRWFGPSARPVWREKIPFAAVALIAAVLAVTAQRAASLNPDWPRHGPGIRLLGAFGGMSLGLWKTVWPANLSPLYAVASDAGVIDRRFLLGGVALIVLGMVFWAVRRRWAAPLAAWVCYVTLSAPVLRAVLGHGIEAADRYTYLACMSWAVLVGAALAGCLRAAVAGRLGRPATAIALAAVAAVIGGLSVRTRAQADIWNGPLSLCEEAARRSPDSFMARILYADVLADSEAYDTAADEYRECLRIRPASVRAINGLGFALINADRPAEAEPELRRAVQLDPEDGRAHFGLGMALSRQNKYDAAIEHLEKARQIKPDKPVAYTELGKTLLQAKRTDRAMAVYRQALERWPDSKRLYATFGNTLTAARQFNAATEILRMGFEATGKDPGTGNQLAWLLATCPEPEGRNGPEAVQVAEQVCRATGNEVAAYVDTLAAAYAEAGRFDDAVRTQKEAIKLAELDERPGEVEDFRRRLSLFENRQPYREEPQTE